MKNSGFMKVFKFSYVQAMKSKSNRIMLAIFIIVSLVFFPAKTIISGSFNNEKKNDKKIEKVYVNTENEELYNKFTTIINAEFNKAADFKMVSDKEYDSIIEELKGENSNALYLEISFDEDETSDKFGLYYKLVYGNGEAAKDMAKKLEGVLGEKSKDVVIAYYGISEEVAQTLTPSEFETKVYDTNGNEVVDNSGLNNSEYWFTYGVIMVLIIITSMIGSTVAEGIVSEKANRVIEYIMINLKPMELIIGKVLSGMAILFTMVASVLVPLTISSYLNKALDKDAKTLFEMLGGFVEDGTLNGINVINVLLVILIIFAGCYFYSILGGLSGGMVSKVEEMAEGLKIYMILFMIGAYLAMFMAISANTAGSGWGAMSYVVYLLPVSSMFIMPSYLLIGKVETWIAVAALIIVVLAAALLTVLASRIFGQMLYHNGSPMKIKDIISMTKEGEKHEK